MSERSELDRLLAGARTTRVTRREMLRRMGVGAGALSTSALLGACGIGGDSPKDREPGRIGTLDPKDAAGELAFANWDFYIDRDNRRYPTIEAYEKEFSAKVRYKETILDNESFFATIRPQLAAQESTGWDVIVVTDWLIAKMIRLDYLETLDHELLKNFNVNAGDIYKNPVYDLGNAHSLPWQSGVTGIGYNPKLTKREITRFEDLFDPAFEGKVGMMTEMRDTMNLTLLNLGIDPPAATDKDAEAAQKKLLQQRDAGIVRQYYGNNYVKSLKNGDIWLSMAWSGDIFQAQFENPDLKFVVPEEGGIIWVDNMAIPVGAEHPVDAHLFMDFVYRPEIAAQITGYVNYICPVPAAKDLLLEQAKKDKDPYYKQVAESPLVFTTPDMESRLSHYKDLDEEEEEFWNDLFGGVIQG